MSDALVAGGLMLACAGAPKNLQGKEAVCWAHVRTTAVRNTECIPRGKEAGQGGDEQQSFTRLYSLTMNAIIISCAFGQKPKMR